MEIKTGTDLHNILQLCRCKYHILGHNEKWFFSSNNSHSIADDTAFSVISWYGAKYSPISQVSAMLLFHRCPEEDLVITLSHAIVLYKKLKEIVSIRREAYIGCSYDGDFFYDKEVPRPLWDFLACFFLSLAVTQDDDYSITESLLLYPLSTSGHLGINYQKDCNIVIKNFRLHMFNVFERLNFLILPDMNELQFCLDEAKEYCLEFFDGKCVSPKTTSIIKSIHFSPTSLFNSSSSPCLLNNKININCINRNILAAGSSTTTYASVFHKTNDITSVSIEDEKLMSSYTNSSKNNESDSETIFDEFTLFW